MQNLNKIRFHTNELEQELIRLPTIKRVDDIYQCRANIREHIEFIKMLADDIEKTLLN